MSKKRRRQTTVQPSPSPPMRGVENSARAVKALRSVEATKLRKNLVQVFNEVTNHVPNPEARISPSRTPRGKSFSEPIPRRNLPSPSELQRTRMPSQVRDFLQDGIRAVACERRRARKEVIHALRRSGKAGARNKKAKWTEKSYMRCK